MKKIILLFVCCTLLSGCIKSNTNYNTVDEYEKAMAKVQKKNAGYILEGTMIVGGKTISFNTKIKDAFNWKEMLIMPDGRVLETLSNGRGTFVLTENGYKPYPIGHSLTAWLLNWNNPDGSENISTKEFVNNSARINGIPCRMLKYTGYNKGTINMCVNDDYGIAVYYKVNHSINPKLVGHEIKLKSVKTYNFQP